jgi:biopolymer transport protein TolR
MSISISSSGKEEVKSEPNVVPLCDVLLVLLIIFMIVTPLVQKGVDVQLPNAQFTSPMPDSPEIILSIKKDGTLYLKDSKIAVENLQNALEEALLTATEKKLFLRADQDLEYGKIVDILDLIRDSGIDVMGIITEKKTDK